MIDPTLLASSLGASVAAGIFLAAGLQLRLRRAGAAADRTAIQMLSLWWLGLALYAVAGASADMVAALGARPFALFLVLGYMQLVALCIGLWGLMYHLAYVLTGEARLLVPLASFYALYYAALLFLITLGRPAGVDVDPWPRLALAAPVLHALGAAALLAIPPLVAAAIYLLLFTKAEAAPQRLRIALVSVGTGAWFLGALAREATPRSLAAPVLLGLLAAWAVSWAYAPPAWVRRRWAA